MAAVIGPRARPWLAFHRVCNEDNIDWMGGPLYPSGKADELGEGGLAVRGEEDVALGAADHLRVYFRFRRGEGHVASVQQHAPICKKADKDRPAISAEPGRGHRRRSGNPKVEACSG